MSGSDKKRLFLLDGTALAYRSYFAFIRNPLINSKGMDTSSVFGFTNTLMKILREERPDYLACVFDTRKPTFRHKKYPEYKATRDKMPEEMAEQLPVIREVVEAFRIPVIEIEGFEADDVIGTLAKDAERQGIDVYMVTGDKDFMQLVSNRVKMYKYSGGRSKGDVEIIDPDGVVERMGVNPQQIVDLLGLMGDSSDNVPGVPGIGPKTAKQLIESFGTIEALLERVDEVEKERIRAKLIEYRDQAKLSKELVTIHTDVPVGLKISDLRVQGPDQERIIRLFQELEFRTLLKELSQISGKTRTETKRKYRAIKTLSELDRLVEILKSSKMFSVDLETTSIDPMSADIVGLSFSWKKGEAAYVPVVFPEMDESGDIFEEHRGEEILKRLKVVLEDPGIRKCGQNIKYDILVLRRHGIRLGGVDFDTMIAAYLINPSSRQYSIDALAMEYLKEKKISTKELIGRGKSQILMAEVDLDKITEYSCEDADVAYRLRTVLEPKLKENKMEDLFKNLEMPLVQVLVEMEENGVALDTDLLNEMSMEMEQQLERLKGQIYEIAGESFNINSTQQLGTILFEKLKVHEFSGMRRPRRTKTGYATDIKVLESLSGHPLPRKILDYRQLKKLKSTYIDALPRLINPSTGRVHASFNQTTAATGRLSSSDPNLQNIPVRTELGREIRKAFVPGKRGWKLVSADYNQIELRIMAHLSGDDRLIESFVRGEDVHRRTASEIFQIPQERVTEEHRRMAKTINFGIMYGMGPYGLSSRLNISIKEAQEFINAYFTRYPKVNEFISRIIAHAYEDGYVTTLLNRRRYLPGLRSENRNIREFAERMAVNTPIQGSAADLIKVAMINIAEKLRNEKWNSIMILQIHDELVFESPADEVESLSDMVRSDMEGAIELDVPIKVDIGVGNNWYEAH